MKIITILLASIMSFILLSHSAAAFDLFSNCITEADGTKVCGPCASNPNAPTCTQASNQGGENNNRITGTGNIINATSNVLALITGVAAVIMIIIGGFTMVTSGGSTEAVTAARRRIIYSVIGLVVVALAWTIIRFVSNRLIQ
jgi:hypothetical protein